MKFKKIIIFILTVTSLFSLSACTKNTDIAKKKIAVIAKSTDSDFWQNVKRGVNAAATEFNAEVSFNGPKKEEDYISQNNMIKEAVEKNYDAILLSAIDFKNNSKAVKFAHDAGLKIITIDSDVDFEKTSMFIGTDNIEAGKKAGMALTNHFNHNRILNIGLINCHHSTENILNREKGFKEHIKDYPNINITATISSESNTLSATAAAISLIEKHPEINVLIAFNEWTTLGIGSAVKKLNLQDKIYAIGFDTNIVSIGMLETGEMDSLIIQNPFAMGYLGVKSATEILDNKAVPKVLYTSTAIIDKKNMYDETNQKLLFQFK